MRLRLANLNPYSLWALLALPSLAMMFEAATSDSGRVFHQLVHPSGETSARLLIIALMATPLALLFKGWRGPIWLKKNRRYFGVAAFGYAVLHTVFYLIDKSSLNTVLAEVPRVYIWTGWLAIMIFIPLGVTSMDYFVRVMGTKWKALQRWTYPAAVLTLLHWAALHNWEHPAAAIVHFAPLALLECYRVYYWYLRPKLGRPVRG